MFGALDSSFFAGIFNSFGDGVLHCSIIMGFGIFFTLLVLFVSRMLYYKLVYVPSNPASLKAFLYLHLIGNCLTLTLTFYSGIAWRWRSMYFFFATELLSFTKY